MGSGRFTQTNFVDAAFRGLIILGGGSTLLALALVFLYLLGVAAPLFWSDVDLASLILPIQPEGASRAISLWQPAVDDSGVSAFNLLPLFFGSLKAALLAMSIAAPLGVLAAIYCALYLPGSIRSWAKPALEFLAAIPTIVIAFVALVWLQPILERNLGALVMVLFAAPILSVLAAQPIARLGRVLFSARAGQYASIAIMISLIFVGSYLFGERVVDIPPQNAEGLLVAIALGLAVLPITFSLSETAISRIPAGQIEGALGLGASRWQAATRVALPLAAPALGAALLIGFARAAGETMIVLVVSGNMPILDPSILEGMRTVAATLAIELPETARGSVHYRVLFLAALLLFILVVVCNSCALLLRGRARR